MSLTISPDLNEAIQRINAIIRELEMLRRQLELPVAPQSSNLTQDLFGALGYGTWDEYDPDLEWQRFSP